MRIKGLTVATGLVVLASAPVLGGPAWGQTSQPSINEFHPACDGVTDDSLALAMALKDAAGTGVAVHVPPRCRLLMGPAARLAGSPAVLEDAALVGDNGRDSADGRAQYGTRGGTILLADTGGPAFIAKRNWRLQGLIFYWPTQVEGPDAPHAMPPLLSGAGGSGITGAASAEVSSGRFIDNDVVNAFVLMDFSHDPAGGLQLRNNRIWCLETCLRLRQMPLESWVSGNQFSPNADWSTVAVGPTFHLRDTGASQGSVLQIVGEGTATASPVTSVDGLSFSDNTVFGMGYALRVSGGWANLLTMTDNRIDGTPHVIALEAGGKITGGTLSGGLWYSYTLGAPDVATYPISAIGSAGGGSSLSIDNVSVVSSSAGIVDWQAPGADLSLTNIRAAGMNNHAGGHASGVRYGSSGGRLRVIGSELGFAQSSPGPCLDLVSKLQMLTVALTQFINCPAPISATAPLGSVVVTGNQSIGTTGNAAYIGAMAGQLPGAGNVWDKPLR